MGMPELDAAGLTPARVEALFQDVVDGRSVSGCPGRRNEPNTGADPGASPRLVNSGRASAVGINTCRTLLPLPTASSCASPLSRRMTWPHLRLTGSETRRPPGHQWIAGVPNIATNTVETHGATEMRKPHSQPCEWRNPLRALGLVGIDLRWYDNRPKL